MGGSTKKNLVAALIVGNEADRYLREVLAHLQTYVDGLIVLDDGSTDGTDAIIQEQPKLIAFRKRTSSGFWTNEAELRQELWSMIESVAPQWVLAIDADEIFDEPIKAALPSLLRQERFQAVRFPIYHFWGDRRHIRVDKWWDPRRNYEIMLFRYKPEQSYHWPQRELHCGRTPMEVLFYPSRFSHIRLYHYGWANPEEIKAKYNRYKARDGSGQWCPMDHYNSILDAHPTLRHLDDGRLNVEGQHHHC